MATKDPRTEKVHHPEKGSHKVTPEVAAALIGKNVGWTRDHDPKSVEAQIAKATAPLKARIAELEAELAEHGGNDMPEKADERVAWIGTDPARAQQALDDENARGDKARTTVTDHTTSVLNPDPTTQEA